MTLNNSESVTTKRRIPIGRLYLAVCVLCGLGVVVSGSMGLLERNAGRSMSTADVCAFVP